jgi:predicted HAD superfamily Cof-like phosphohydrolase
MTKLREQVSEFHRAFGVPMLEKPTVPPNERIKLRLRLIAEEFVELLEAAGCWRGISTLKDGIDGTIASIGAVATMTGKPIAPFDMVEVADALADLQVVICGSELEFGIDGAKVLDEVMASNLSKVGSTIRADGKIMKDAPGFFRPDIARVLTEQGWEGAGHD